MGHSSSNRRRPGHKPCGGCVQDFSNLIPPPEIWGDAGVESPHLKARPFQSDCWSNLHCLLYNPPHQPLKAWMGGGTMIQKSPGGDIGVVRQHAPMWPRGFWSFDSTALPAARWFEDPNRGSHPRKWFFFPVHCFAIRGTWWWLSSNSEWNTAAQNTQFSQFYLSMLTLKTARRRVRTRHLLRLPTPDSVILISDAVFPPSPELCQRPKLSGEFLYV